MATEQGLSIYRGWAERREDLDDAAMAELITSLPQPTFLFDRGNLLTYEKGTPRSKLVGTVDWTIGDAGILWKATHYANVTVPNNNPTFDYDTGDAWLMDLELRYKLPMNVSAALGVNNMFDKYPNFTPGVINSPTGSIGFPNYSLRKSRYSSWKARKTPTVCRRWA